MAISYPLNTPTNIGIANIAFTAENAVAISQSPFTYAQQVVSHPGQRWGASISLPPMKRQDAEYWVAFLLSLKGQAGTFLLGDPNCVAAQGSATAKRNLISYTEEFDNAYWAKTRSSVPTPNTIVAPNGLTTADFLVEDTTPANSHFLSRGYTFVAGETYTFSVYVKAQSALRNLRMAFPTVQFGGVSSLGNFNLTTGGVISIGGGVTALIETVGDWYRTSITKQCTVSGGGSVSFVLLQGTTVSVYDGDGVSGVYLWGAQLEVSSAPTSYQAVSVSYGPFVNGASQIGDTLVIDGCSPSVTGFLMPGDYIQLGAASSTTLHKVLTQVDTDSVGGATLDIWPNIRTAPADNAAVVVANTKGLFRLKDNITQWQINDISSYGITFDCVEAI